MTQLGATRAGELAADIVRSLGTVIHAPKATLELVVLGLLAEGHLILEDFPGVGKTMLAKALARSVDCDFSRLQFTPDLLPSDITGVNVFSQQTNGFEFRPGPVFANLLLVDEINRASPKTQSALLECMQENQVTVDGVSYQLQRPFLVMATQNPIEYEGTYPLPEAQLDRFTMLLAARLPAARRRGPDARRADRRGTPLEELEPVCSGEEVVAAIHAVREVFVDERLPLRRGRPAPHPRRPAPVARREPALGHRAPAGGEGPGPDDGRDYVVPDDMKRVAEPVLAHRLLLAPQARSAGHTGAEAVADALEHTPIPV